MVFKLWKHMGKKPEDDTYYTTSSSNPHEEKLLSQSLDIEATPILRRSKKFYHLTTGNRYSWEHIEDVSDTSSVENKGVGIIRSIGDVIEMETRSYVSDLDIYASDTDEEYAEYNEHMIQETYDLQAMTVSSSARTSATITPEREPGTPVEDDLYPQQPDHDEDGDTALLDDIPKLMMAQEEQHLEGLGTRLRSVQQSPRLVSVAKKMKLEYFTFERPPSPLRNIGNHHSS